MVEVNEYCESGARRAFKRTIDLAIACRMA